MIGKRWTKGTWVSNRDHFKELPPGNFDLPCSPIWSQGLGKPSRSMFPNVPMTWHLHSGLPAKWAMLRLPLLYLGGLQVIQDCMVFLELRREGNRLGQLSLFKKVCSAGVVPETNSHTLQPEASSQSTVWPEKWIYLIPCPWGKQFWRWAYFLDATLNNSENRK